MLPAAYHTMPVRREKLSAKNYKVHEKTKISQILRLYAAFDTEKRENIMLDRAYAENTLENRDEKCYYMQA